MNLLKKSLPLWIVLLIAVSTIGVTLAISPILVNLNILPFKETPVLEEDIEVVSKHFSVTGTTIAPNTGAELAPIEFDDPYSDSSTGADKGDYIYTFLVQETSPTALSAGEKFKVDIYVDDVLIGTIYMGQATVPASDVVEGVKCTVSVGKTIQSIDIIITRLA